MIVWIPERGLDAYKELDGWKNFHLETIEHYYSWSFAYDDYQVEDDPEDDSPTYDLCDSPVFAIENGKLVVTSTTEGSSCNTTITSADIKNYIGREPIDLNGIYTISSFAFANGYQNSEIVTATLVWVNPTLLDDGVLTMDAKKAVLIRVDGGNVVVCGTEAGERLALYTLGGEQLCTVTASGSETILPCTMSKGEVVIVKYGDKTVKIKI